MNSTIDIATPRTWPELSAEVQSRAERQVYPKIGTTAADVRRALEGITSTDREQWGSSWSSLANEYLQSATTSEPKDPMLAADAYLAAWRYASFNAWPTAATPSKRASYLLGLEALRRYAALKCPQLEHIRIPFEDGEISAYLRMPENVSSRAPVLITISGLDSHKEHMTERFGPECFARGIGHLTVDAPGTAEAPLKADARGARMYSTVIDYLLSRADVDGRQIGVVGVSLGGYWATKLAFLEAPRTCQ